MNRALLAASLWLLSTGCVVAPAGEIPEAASRSETSLIADSVAWRSRAYTVRVQNLTCEGLGVGSGFLIDEHTLVTNRHVVDGARRLAVSTWDGHRLEVSTGEEATIADLALIRLKEEAGPVAALGGANPAVGAPVYAAGYPGGGRFRITEGEVTGYVDGAFRENRGRVVEIDATVRPGNSGGPLIDAAGDVVGVVYAIDLMSRRALALPISTLKSVLRGGTSSQPPRQC